MGLTVNDAYNQIKALENNGHLTLPEPKDIVTVGTIDPKAGTFTWTVPTVVQTIVIPPGPGGRTNTIINTTVGVVATQAIDLQLKFAIIPQPGQLVNEVARSTRPSPSATPAATVVAAHNTALLHDVLNTSVLGQTNGGVTIDGYPVVSVGADHITLDVGLIVSTVIQNVPNMTPPVGKFSVQVNIPGHPSIQVPFYVLRPPAVGLGGFTIPALPMTIVYAPPQGKDKKNTAVYADTSTITRQVTTAVTNSTNTKTAQAYSAADLVGKVASSIATVVAVVGTGGAGAAGGASVAGAFSELGQALFGTAKEKSDSVADAAKQVGSELSAVQSIFNAVDSNTSSDTGTITAEDDHSLTLTTANLNQWGAAATLGPGVGDRIVYMKDVKVVWAAVNGELCIHVLGFSGFGANSVQDLQQERTWITGGNPPRLGLDVDTIRSLLLQDPLSGEKASGGGRNVIVSTLFGPLIGAPRFVPAVPPGRSGTSTGPQGDQFQSSYEVTSEDKHIRTSSQVNITDAKPSWVSVLFGADNQETTTTTTFTTSQVTDDKSDDKVVSTITLYSQNNDDKYDVKIFYDNLFGTYVVLDSNSSALKGIELSHELNDVA